MDRFSGIEEFVATAKLGSFTAAASSLGVTKSAVGKSLARLEARLGARLFHRTTRRLSLTSDGQVLLEACSGILAGLEAAESAIGSGTGAPIGRVRIDAPSAFGRLYVVPVLVELLAVHPELTLGASFTDRRVDLIEEGIDVLVRIGAAPDTTDVVARRLGVQTLVVCASPGYLAQHGAPMVKEDLPDHRCIVGRRNRTRHAWLLRTLDGATERYPITAHHEFEDGEAMLAAAVAGLGIAQLPTWLAKREFAEGILVPVLPGLSGGQVPISAIWANSRPVPRRVQAVVEALACDFVAQSVLHVGETHLKVPQL